MDRITKTANNICRKVGKPSSADALALGMLFPSSSAPRKRTSIAFDPNEECVVQPQKQKKKSTRVKPRFITVVLPNSEVSVPRGNKRRQLDREGRMKKLSFLRTMSWQQVKNTILRGIREQFQIGQCDGVWHGWVFA